MDALYEGKFFYEVVKTGDSKVLNLIGPLDTIRYVEEGKRTPEYAFVEVKNGEVRAAFRHDEILVLERKL